MALWRHMTDVQQAAKGGQLRKWSFQAGRLLACELTKVAGAKRRALAVAEPERGRSR